MVQTGLLGARVGTKVHLTKRPFCCCWALTSTLHLPDRPNPHEPGQSGQQMWVPPTARVPCVSQLNLGAPPASKQPALTPGLSLNRTHTKSIIYSPYSILHSPFSGLHIAHLGLFPPSQVPELLACWLISLATMPGQAISEQCRALYAPR